MRRRRPATVSGRRRPFWGRSINRYQLPAQQHPPTFRSKITTGARRVGAASTTTFIVWFTSHLSRSNGHHKRTKGRLRLQSFFGGKSAEEADSSLHARSAQKAQLRGSWIVFEKLEGTLHLTFGSDRPWPICRCGPTLGTVISLRQTGSSRTIASTALCSFSYSALSNCPNALSPGRDLLLRAKYLFIDAVGVNPHGSWSDQQTIAANLPQSQSNSNLSL